MSNYDNLDLLKSLSGKMVTGTRVNTGMNEGKEDKPVLRYLELMKQKAPVLVTFTRMRNDSFLCTENGVDMICSARSIPAAFREDYLGHTFSCQIESVDVNISRVRLKMNENDIIDGYKEKQDAFFAQLKKKIKEEGGVYLNCTAEIVMQYGIVFNICNADIYAYCKASQAGYYVSDCREVIKPNEVVVCKIFALRNEEKHEYDRRGKNCSIAFEATTRQGSKNPWHYVEKHIHPGTLIRVRCVGNKPRYNNWNIPGNWWGRAVDVDMEYLKTLPLAGSSGVGKKAPEIGEICMCRVVAVVPEKHLVRVRKEYTISGGEAESEISSKVDVKNSEESSVAELESSASESVQSPESIPDLEENDYMATDTVAGNVSSETVTSENIGNEIPGKFSDNNSANLKDIMPDAGSDGPLPLYEERVEEADMVKENKEEEENNVETSATENKRSMDVKSVLKGLLG